MKRNVIGSLAVIAGAVVLASVPCRAWEHHTLLTGPLVESMPEITSLPTVEAVPLQDFLVSAEATLATVLAQE